MQLREKTASTREFLNVAKAAKAVTDRVRSSTRPLVVELLAWPVDPHKSLPLFPPLFRVHHSSSASPSSSTTDSTLRSQSAAISTSDRMTFPLCKRELYSGQTP